jgi:linoleoyl-CoA desaturase
MNKMPSKNQLRYRYKIHNKLYDLTDFVKIHPGGIDMFDNLKTDFNITPLIYSYHKNPKTTLEILPKYEVPLPDDLIIQYDTDYNYDEYCKLKKLVHQEIHEKKIPLYWSNNEIAYNSFMFSINLGVWSYCFLNSNGLSYWWIVLLALINIGHNNLLFHETLHYTGFKNQMINRIIMSWVLYPFFSVSGWKERHNYLHHSFTNTEYDVDFDKNKLVLRYSNTHKHYQHHRLQHIYIGILCVLNGFNKTIRRNIQLREYRSLFGITFIYYWLGIQRSLLLFGLFGFGYTFIAQLSHIHNECVQINTHKKNDYLYNQISSTANFRTDNFITRFISYGLDIQIEHHLFPNIPHSSLRQIQHVVRKYCNENDIPYSEKSNMFQAICSYLYYLRTLGNP